MNENLNKLAKEFFKAAANQGFIVDQINFGYELTFNGDVIPVSVQASGRFTDRVEKSK
jgi:hypothetical protein